MATTREVLVTGAAGFIGYHLVKRLSEDPSVRVTCVDNLQRGGDVQLDADLRTVLARPNVGLIHADLTEPDVFDVDIPPRPFDDVYHLAAVNGTKHFYAKPADVLRTNTLTLIHLLDWIAAAKSPPRLLFTSSNEVYAGTDAAFRGRLPLPTGEHVPLVISDPYNPRWSYAGSKLVGELMVIHAARQHGFEAVIVRPHNFYGPRAGADHVIPEAIGRILDAMKIRDGGQDLPFPIYGREQTRSFCYIDDAVDAMIRVMPHASATAPTVHIGTPTETAIYELFDLLFEIAGWTPEASAIEYRPAPPGSVARRVPYIGRIREMTGWEPSTPLRGGLERTFEWYRDRRAARASAPA